MDNKELMVTIRCLAYNHEPYIRQCLDGFVMQKTNFRFEAIVHDDASTDGTVAIIKEYAEKYPDIIKPIFESENRYSKRDGSLRRIMDEHMHGKYIALCEGDDYWIDPYKLQKQVDFLEKNPDYGLVCSEINIYYQDKNTFENNFFKNKNTWNIEYTFDNFIINTWFLAPCTWLYRRKYIINMATNNRFVVGDLPLLLEISGQSKVKYIEESMAVYRVLSKSASHGFNFIQQENYRKRILQIQSYYMKKYNKQYLKRKIICRWFLVMAKIACNFREYRKMFLYLCDLVKYYLGIQKADLN